MATIEENAEKVLNALANAPRRAWLSGVDLTKSTGINEPDEINDAMRILVDAGPVEWIQTLGTHPYRFLQAQISPRGRYEAERAAQTPVARQAPQSATAAEAIRPPVPIGSPYGFQDEDWEFAARQKSESSKLHVTLGFQFKSDHYDSDRLKSNIKSMLQKAVADYIAQPNTLPIALEFRPLAAGYGEHLFNQIARDIIGADIAIFDTSDLNPNVMLEMGVALTWGVCVLPIKAEGCDRPPSDVSGQLGLTTRTARRNLLTLITLGRW
jgi:hypothetical protein